MDIQKRRFKAILIVLFCYAYAYAQTWETTVVYDDSLQTLMVTVEPQYPIETYQVSFTQNIFQDRAIKDFHIGKNVKGEWQYEPVKGTFNINESIGKFYYTVDLKQSTNVPTQAIIEFSPILLANWSEILFALDMPADLSISFIREDKKMSLGIKSLEEWKLDPTAILPIKTLVQVNNISIYTNLQHENLSKLMTKTLANFTYFEEDFDLFVLFGNDSSKTGGAFYENAAVVYIDALASDPKSPFVIEQVVLHELFHGVSPYDMRPEMEAHYLDKNWLAEATPEYLALKYLLNNELITEIQFLETMESKLRLSQRFSGLSLNDMSFEVYRNPSYFQAFYTRGAVALFLLELELYKTSNGALNVIDIVTGDFPDMSEGEQVRISNILSGLEQDLVYNENDLPMNKYLVDFGLIYEKRVVLPFNENSETAEVRKENISFNKVATAEQKSRWKGFIAN